MKTYLLKRLSTVFGIGVGMAIFPFIIVFLFHSPFDSGLRILLFYVGIFVPSLFMKPSWYLLLPYSRKKLYALHVMEVVLESLILLVLFDSSFLILANLLHETGSLKQIALGSLVILPVMFIRFALVAKTTSLRPVVPSLSRHNFRHLFRSWKFLAGYAGISCVYYYGDPWLLALIVMILFLQWPVIGLRVLQYPHSSLQRLNQRALRALAPVSIIVICAVYAILYLAPAQSAATELSLRFIGHLPAPVNSARAYALFDSPQTSASKAALRIFRSPNFRVNQEHWESKVAWCQTANCLNLADKVVPEGQTVSDGNLKRFGELMAHCRPALADDGRVRCLGPKLSDGALNRWSKILANSSEAKNWLNARNQTFQVIALKALTFEVLTPEQAEIVSNLARSTNPVLRAAAVDNLSFDRARLNGKVVPKASMLF